ncbi:hypothetical protein IHE71_15005 [Myceligenerans sp. TRM 65318]|uniref:Integral membrane protein n=1 Tax=Myceligenerans pegani TaxID=2776917 RepID=A0ABR9N022_9MICO|nr:hypothetical protein [Myceligenerans sp. TRM 65318]MBE3019273.1 hypothetical protein [Myceligenerans sp. TRM 65318]
MSGAVGDAGRGATRPPAAARSTGAGFGRVLVTVYGVLAFAALGRSSYELVTKFAEAPVAYSLSALAAVVYVVATVALALGASPRWRKTAWGAVGVEAAGVLAVGSASLANRDVFGESTVWSLYGQGYGYVPLVLPFVGLWWLWHTRGPAAHGARGPHPSDGSEETTA